jgi:hypothetical protein
MAVPLADRSLADQVSDGVDGGGGATATLADAIN